MGCGNSSLENETPAQPHEKIARENTVSAKNIREL